MYFTTKTNKNLKVSVPCVEFGMMAKSRFEGLFALVLSI